MTLLLMLDMPELSGFITAEIHKTRVIKTEDINFTDFDSNNK